MSTRAESNLGFRNLCSDREDPIMEIARFMASPFGRGARIAAGVALIVTGTTFGGIGGIIAALVGFAPLAAGVFNFCGIAPLLRAPFSGRQALKS